MENISPHITILEATESATATALKIFNYPGQDALKNMKALALNVFEPLRSGLGNQPIKVTSFFRNADLNKAIGGAKSSQHVTGQAIDLQGIHCTNAEIFYYIKNHLHFDQLIWEFGNNNNPDWVHVSYSQTNNRKQILKAKKVNGKTVYESLKLL